MSNITVSMSAVMDVEVGQPGQESDINSPVKEKLNSFLIKRQVEKKELVG